MTTFFAGVLVWYLGPILSSGAARIFHWQLELNQEKNYSQRDLALSILPALADADFGAPLILIEMHSAQYDF